MADESVIEHPVEEAVETVDPVETPPIVEDTTTEETDSPVETPDTTEKPKPHPLEPGGERFNEIYARLKRAEEERNREREERIRLEERDRISKEQSSKPEQIYTREQLEGWIAEGRITRAQANEYREQKIREQTERKLSKQFEEMIVSQRTQSTVGQDIQTYIKHVPDLETEGSENHTKVVRAYQDLVRNMGAPRDHQQNLSYQREALIRVFGEPEKLTSRPKPQLKAEPMQETTSSGRPSSSTRKSDDPIEKLDARQKAHYERMIKHGRYSGWKEVREELTFKPGPKRS